MSTVALQSCVFESRVLHERFSPRKHRFSYRLFYLALDLDELPELARQSRLFSINGTNLFSFREGDFMPLHEPLHNPGAPAQEHSCTSKTTTLKERVRQFCARHGADFGRDGKVLLVTLPRVFGYLFNPVSFYYCFDKNGEETGAIAEVTNTFREIKLYFLPVSNERNDSKAFRWRGPKQFYVSPFSDLHLDFAFVLRKPGANLAVQIDDYEEGRRILHTTLTGRRRELNTRLLAWFLLKYPFLSLAVMTRIHWQALLLWLKRVPYFSKARHGEGQRDLYRPHPSIKPTVQP